jgi:hypothetical protein
MEKSPHTDAFPKGISQPAIRALVHAGITSLEQVAGKRESDLRKLHGFGPKAIPILRQALLEKGLPAMKP